MKQLVQVLLRLIIYEGRGRRGRPIGSIADDLYPDADWKNEKQGEFDP